MENIITMKSIFIFGLLIISTLDCVKAQTPYCSAVHSISCSSHNMHIGAVRIKEVATVIFDKAADGCNQTSAPNYTLMSTSPSFSLKPGCNYSMSFTTGNNSSVQVGVWIDLNRDNDFSDSGEFVSKGWDHINSGNILQSRTFVLPCGSVTAGTSRMRIRTDSVGSSRWNSGASCATVKYGETEDYTINLDTAVNPAAGFTAMPDTIYAGVLVYFTNKNRNQCSPHRWDIEDNGSTDYSTIDIVHVFSTPGRHCVRLISPNCKGKSDFNNCFNVLDIPLKIYDLKKQKELHFYPNPTKGILIFNNNFFISEVEVFNSLGMSIGKINPVYIKNSIQTIDISHESKGIYTIKYKVNGIRMTEKISVLN